LASLNKYAEKLEEVRNNNLMDLKSKTSTEDNKILSNAIATIGVQISDEDKLAIIDDLKSLFENTNYVVDINLDSFTTDMQQVSRDLELLREQAESSLEPLKEDSIAAEVEFFDNLEQRLVSLNTKLVKLSERRDMIYEKGKSDKSIETVITLDKEIIKLNSRIGNTE